jgi:phenylpropionate dioxygenase-like ring-hydroxylating dioxygenase large terminal subunit
VGLPVIGELGLPNGWFAAALSRELPPGKVITRRFMSEDLVLYRPASGEARAVSAYCPHLGAHLGHCGSVEGDTIRCSFHNSRFDGAGACTATGYGTRPPPAARLPVHAVREQHGVIFVWHDAAGRPPAWQLPALDIEGWSAIHFERLSLGGHPQETTENSVDVGHFSVVHGYTGVKEIAPARTEGPYLTARYAMTRAVTPLARLGARMSTEFTVHVHGLGYSRVDVDVLAPRLRTRQFVLSTPTDAGRIDLLLGMSVEVPGLRALGPLAEVLPLRHAADALARVAFRDYAHDVKQDFVIWEHKRYMSRPALAAGDGPVGLYRKWASQFYATS